MRKGMSRKGLRVIFTVVAAVLFVEFSWSVRQSDQETGLWRHGHDSDATVIGRLVQSRQEGVFSYGGLLGLGGPSQVLADWGSPAFEFQYDAYHHGVPFGSFSPYRSQIGAQGLVFSILDALLRLPTRTALLVFRTMAALCTSLVLAALVVWFLRDIGVPAASGVLAGILLSPWLLVFGRSLFWSFWSFYVPMLIMIGGLNQHDERAGWVKIALWAFVGVFTKCIFSGYEYITTALVMMTVPIVFYWKRKAWSWRTLCKVFIAAFVGSALAGIASLLILSVQIASVDGSLLDGIRHVTTALERRTIAVPSITSSEYEAYVARPNVLAVLVTYLFGGSYMAGLTQESPYVARLLWHLKFGHFVLLFATVTVVFRRLAAFRGPEISALVAATWYSALAPVSWLIIFHEHSAVHTHMNYIVWYMPFMLFGFAVCGCALDRVLDGIRCRVQVAGSRHFRQRQQHG